MKIASQKQMYIAYQKQMKNQNKTIPSKLV